MTQREYQRNFCAAAMSPILNIACKEDPYRLGADFGAVNLDYLTYDPHMKVDLTKLPNFVQGDARKLQFPDGEFAAVVMGEFIEHCIAEVGIVCIKEAARVLSDGGLLCLTFPRDSRPPHHQHAREHLVQWAEGITSWHQTVWEDDMLSDAFAQAGLEELSREPIDYSTSHGLGITLKKIGNG